MINPLSPNSDENEIYVYIICLLAQGVLEHNGVPNVLLRLLEDSASVELLEEEEELAEVNPPLAAGVVVLTAQSTTFSGIPLSDCSGCGILGTRLQWTLADRDFS